MSGTVTVAAPGVAEWFNTAAFSQPATFTFCNEGVGIIRAAGIMNTDLSVIRSFKTTEKSHLELRGEFFNATNHTNSGLPADRPTLIHVRRGQLPGRRARWRLESASLSSRASHRGAWPAAGGQVGLPSKLPRRGIEPGEWRMVERIVELKAEPHVYRLAAPFPTVPTAGNINTLVLNVV